jgi:predicted aspartyl protease
MQSVKGELKKTGRYVHADVVMMNPLKPNLKQTVRFIADTGAVGCVIPLSIAKKLQLESKGKIVAVMADGSQKPLDTSFAVLEFAGKRLYAWVAYAKGFDALLGVDIMEVLGIHVDVPNKNLLMPIKRFSIKNLRIMFGWKK